MIHAAKNAPATMPTATVIRIFQSPGVLTLDEVNAVPPKILAIERLPDGRMELSGKGPRGATHRMLATTNVLQPVTSWSGISTGQFAGGVFTLIDSKATNYSGRFYRVLRPSP